MNQTKKRLHIIKLAISITDIDCIQHQILKLSQLRSDAKLQKILDMLHSKNYAQAQALITAYIDTPIDEIIQRSTQENTPSEETQAKMIREIKESAVIEAFDLFPEPEDEQEIKELENIDFLITKYLHRREHPLKRSVSHNCFRKSSSKSRTIPAYLYLQQKIYP